MLVDDEDSTFARNVGRIGDKIKQQPWIVVVYWSLERQMYCKYENNRQCEGTTVLEAIKNTSSMIINAFHLPLCL